MRKDIVSIVNALAAEDGSLDFPLFEAYGLILGYCKAKKLHPSQNEYKMKNGCLFINGSLVRRLVPLPSMAFALPGECDYEELILKRQECYA